MKKKITKTMLMVVAFMAIFTSSYSASLESKFIVFDKDNIQNIDKIEQIIKNTTGVEDFLVNPNNGVISILCNDEFDNRVLMSEIEQNYKINKDTKIAKNDTKTK